MPIVSCGAIALLVAIAAVHLFWAAGGSAGKAAPLSVGAGLIPNPFPSAIIRTATAGLALLFFARAIGDFRYVGVFKSVTGTLFARRDTFLYSPLCLVLALIIGTIASEGRAI